MGNNLRNGIGRLIKMSRFFLFIISVQSFGATMFIDTELMGQTKSVYEIDITLEKENARLVEVFDELESKTDFKFSYYSNVVKRNNRVTLHNETSFGAVLESISKQTNLRFKRINQNITSIIRRKITNPLRR
ncbi:hypothetical protein [Fulvivirga ligni]|uniref:hypothetical protein n=1 Tax=Fulvivirga ligni TaxID=2904246 RepID=UPI001F3D34B4|nr:hypothetical protein [Fulvivirga ligni]UII18952.1 hypothetical protein LVD16_13995 [Fulvivirga ligni]